MTDPTAAPDVWAPFTLNGWRVRWVWVVSDPDDGESRRLGVTPAGIEIDHGDHRVLVVWVPAEGARTPFTVESMFPLTLGEPVTCGRCRVTGQIVAGVWAPTEGGEREQ